MNEWIDFLVYAIQAALFCFLVPNWNARFTRALLFDRNPDWATANPQTVAQLERGSVWTRIVQGWGVVAMGVLLAVRLNLESRAHGWEVLFNANNLLVTVTVIVHAFGYARFSRWLNRNVPLAEPRQATLTPRRLDDFAPRWVQYLLIGLWLFNVAARPMADQLFPGRLHHVLEAFVPTLFGGAAFVFAVYGSVARRPNILDRVFGAAYRRREVRACLTLAFVVLTGMLLGLGLEIVGIDMRRYSGVIISAAVSAILIALISFPPPRDGVVGHQDAGRAVA